MEGRAEGSMERGAHTQAERGRNSAENARERLIRATPEAVAQSGVVRLRHTRDTQKAL